MATPTDRQNRSGQRIFGSVKSMMVSMILIGGLAGCGGGGEPKVTRSIEPTASTEDIEALVRLGDYLQERGELSTAIALYQRAAGKSDNAYELIKLGRALAAAGATERAAGVFRRAVSREPENPDALLGLGKAYLELGQIEKSIQYLDQLVKQGNGTDLIRYAALGAAFDLAGQHERAVATYRAGLEIEPNNLDLKSNLALSYALNDRHDEAIRIMWEVTDALDARRTHQRNLVLVLALAGQDREAVSVGVRQLGETETRDVLAQAESARGLDNSADRARALGAS